MPFVQSNGAKLYYEETGSGQPIVFVHEFAADHREWEPQVRWFSRNYRCITFNARGYPPSDVPDEPALYGYEHARDDVAVVVRHLGLTKTHVVGLSMGAYATLHFGLAYPDLCRSLVVAGGGSGASPATRAAFRAESEARGDAIAKDGMGAFAQTSSRGPTRVQLEHKDPRGWATFVEHLSQHSAQGSAMTMRRYQAPRPPLTDFAAQLKALTVPTLLAVGDEDEPCLDINLYLKRLMPSAALLVLPRSGHAINLEEPQAFNRMVDEFFHTVENGRWRLRDY